MEVDKETSEETGKKRMREEEKEENETVSAVQEWSSKWKKVTA